MFYWVRKLIRFVTGGYNNDKKPPKKPYRKPEDGVIVIDGKVVDILATVKDGFNKDIRAFFIRSLNLLCKIINSQQFKNEFLDGEYSEDYYMDPIDLYMTIMQGIDTVNPVADFVLDMVYSLYEGNTKTIGHTTINQVGIWTNKYFVRKWMKEKYGEAKWAGHIAHELAHNMGKKGFYHRLEHKGTFVYDFGYQIRDIGTAHLKGNLQLTPVTI